MHAKTITTQKQPPKRREPPITFLNIRPTGRTRFIYTAAPLSESGLENLSRAWTPARALKNARATAKIRAGDRPVCKTLAQLDFATETRQLR